MWTGLNGASGDQLNSRILRQGPHSARALALLPGDTYQTPRKRIKKRAGVWDKAEVLSSLASLQMS